MRAGDKELRRLWFSSRFGVPSSGGSCRTFPFSTPLSGSCWRTLSILSLRPAESGGLTEATMGETKMLPIKPCGWYWRLLRIGGSDDEEPCVCTDEDGFCAWLGGRELGESEPSCEGGEMFGDPRAGTKASRWKVTCRTSGGDKAKGNKAGTLRVVAALLGDMVGTRA